MQKHSVMSRVAAVLLAAAAVPFCLAVDTRIWEQSDQAEFARGTPKHLAIRSDGHITLSPEFKELDSTNVPYLWSIAEDSKGTVFYAGGAPTGATTKIIALPRNGKSKTLAEITGLEIHALAVDAQDRVYAAVLPDAKIYRIDSAGKPQLFFDPKCKYVWAMAFDHAGDLFVATGDSGVIYKVKPDGKSSEFARTEETHARSMIIDSQGNLIVGTEPSGLVLRITQKGESFVLYQTNKREVTAVAERDGNYYAAAVGNKVQGLTVTGPPPVLPNTPAPIAGTGVARTGTAPPLLAPAVGSLSASVAGGSELYRIDKEGFAQRIWTSSTNLVYAIAFDATGHALLGTGNKGIVYRVDNDHLSTQLLNAPPTQVTAFLQSTGGTIYAVTGNVGNLYSIGTGTEKTGTLESEVYDASSFVYWGKVHLTPKLTSADVTLETRSGNLNNPENSWSAWAKVPVMETGGQIASPPARFIQYKLTLHQTANGSSPEVSVVDIPYLPKNIAPKIGQIEVAPINYRQAPTSSSLEAAVLPSGSPRSLTLPAIGQRRTSAASATEASAGATLNYNKGFVTVRWTASDENDDSLLFKVEIKGKNDSTWSTLKDKLTDRFYAFDSTAFPDGSYTAQITVSDAPSNTPSQLLMSSLQSDPFIIDNTPPEIVNVKAVNSGGHRQITFTAKDSLSWIDKAECSVNGGEWMLLTPVNKVTDSQVLTYEVSVEQGQAVSVRVFDESDNVAVKMISGQ